MHKYHHKNTSLLAYSLDETSCQRACLASGPFRRQEEWAHLFLPHTVQICHVESSREVRPGFNTLLPMSRCCGQGADVYGLFALQKSSKLTSHAQQLHPSHCQNHDTLIHCTESCALKPQGSATSYVHVSESQDIRMPSPCAHTASHARRQSEADWQPHLSPCALHVIHYFKCCLLLFLFFPGMTGSA